MSRRPLFDDVADPLTMGRRQHKDETDIDITPMIDMTFLLLIFFMVSSTMQATPDLDVPVARHGVGVETRGAIILTIRSGESRNAAPMILLGDGRGPTGELDDVRRLVEEGVRSQRNQVVIKAEGDVPHGFVQEVARAVKSVPGAEITMGVRDEPSKP